jgi:DNA-binding Lrp family transcriptional regulator
MKDVEIRVICELMKNSRRSNRELAKTIGISQPMLSKTIAKLEKEGVLREYTVIPDFRKLGYSLISITLGNVREELRNSEKIDDARREFVKNFDAVSFEIVLDVAGIGMGHDGAIVSLHRSYSEYLDFKKRLMQTTLADPSRFESFLIDLNDERHHRNLTFSFLSDHVLQTLQKRRESSQLSRAREKVSAKT